MTNEEAQLKLSTVVGDGRHSDILTMRELRSFFGDKLPVVLAQQYHKSKSWKQRCLFVYYCIPFARVSDDAVSLGLSAIADKSKYVRFRAFALMAWSQRIDLLERLKLIQSTIHHSSIEDFNAMIDAIQMKNSNYFYDRDHRGNFEWRAEG